MARFHTNRETGVSGPCRATIACPFGDMVNDHHDSIEGARAAYENEVSTDFPPVALKKLKAPAKPARLFGSPKSQELVGSVMGKDYASVISDAKVRASLATEYFSSKGPYSPTIDLNAHTTPASSSTRSDALAALSARRSSVASSSFFSETAPAKASTAVDARAALSARSSQSNSFLSGARKLSALI